MAPRPARERDGSAPLRGGLSVDRVTGTLADGLGAAAATSGILTQQQARIFGLLYLAAHPLSLDEIAGELSQSKSNVSLNMRVLVEWHLVRRRPVPGSRKDHYEAATDFFRAMQEIFERRFRWTVRQVLTAVADARAAATAEPRHSRSEVTSAADWKQRLAGLEAFFGLIDSGIGAFVSGEPFPAEKLRNVIPLPAGRTRVR
jgi:DNA-binding transcriptional regulator GbsR (MarR family)